MSQKLEFVEKATKPGANVSALCSEYGISRQTGHKWLRRYRAQGYAGLVEHSRRPASSPLATAEEVVVSIVELRDKHPSWGAQKLARVLARRLGPSTPSPSTIARVLRRLGKMKRKRFPVRVWTVDGRPRVEVKGPNDLWTFDFKGWWRAQSREICEPLTVRDAFSRKVLAVTLVPSRHTVHVRRVLEGLFRKHGVPLAMQCDNGSPFACSRARGGMTHLSAWLVSLGIRLVRTRPASPQDNGGHERMHRDLSELELRPAKSRAAQQRDCDRWMVDFNEVRPHDALGGKTPSEVYRDSPRRSLVPMIPNYSGDWQTRRVNRMGMVRIAGDSVFVSTALVGHIVGLRQESELLWRARYFDVDLGTLEIVPFDHALAQNSVMPAVTWVNTEQPIRQRGRQAKIPLRVSAMS
jgi:transposase InsO family protein